MFCITYQYSTGSAVIYNVHKSPLGTEQVCSVIHIDKTKSYVHNNIEVWNPVKFTVVKYVNTSSI